ncbi:Uncharacterized protein OS=Sorangium cellulosum (strain So ce56) GN=sce5710 PE=4 SV=1 [Gemmata massiliana]|uniref:SMI1/KNR4 family protein n=1 Tax=Gemmata massiliana TaxID=1210884 RepID=A0A6P2D1F9_9BACT|nr:hypothetical protein [Gemmata massiliana]VTR93252.1 Uncharacterized protein OS=Sorangium cellulosum (strain So ce56) GN=sce5710 PE=4 SV=1 [Gemmata massiliana]
MTEAEWLASEDIEAMFGVVRARSKRRRSRLFAVACCRAIDPALPDPRSQRAISIAELHADGSATDAELASVMLGAHEVVLARASDPAVIEAAASASEGLTRKAAGMRQWSYRMGMERAAECVAVPHPYRAAVQVGELVRSRLFHFQGPDRGAQASILRDIFGHIFRPVAFSPSWRTSVAVALAAQMYESRDFGAMPILADALQDAGCDSADVLDHCRGEGPHVRGCWVVDLVLGKE